MNAAPTLHAFVGAGYIPPACSSMIQTATEGSLAQASRGHCIGLGGLRCSINHTKPAPRVKRAELGCRGTAPAERILI